MQSTWSFRWSPPPHVLRKSTINWFLSRNLGLLMNENEALIKTEEHPRVIFFSPFLQTCSLSSLPSAQFLFSSFLTFFLTRSLYSHTLTHSALSSTPFCSVFLSTGMLWQGVALCYTGFYSPSAYYPVRLNTQVGTKGQARKLQLTSLSTQHNSLTHMKTRVCELSHIRVDSGIS